MSQETVWEENPAAEGKAWISGSCSGSGLLGGVRVRRESLRLEI